MGHKRVELTPKEVDQQIEGLLPERYVARDYLRLFQGVFKAQYQTERKLRAKDLYPSISKKEAAERIRQGLPIIDPNKLQLGERELCDLLQRIGSILVAHDTGGNPAVKLLLEAEGSGDISLRELARQTIADDGEYLGQFSEKMGEDKEGVALLATVLVAPFLRVCARPLRRKVDLDSLPTRRCPICGGAPLMARLREGDGKRMLECSLCNTQWAFNRLRCPFCGNEDQSTLGFFFVEQEDVYRVDKCDRCKRYIKTVDERKKAEDKLRALPVEDVATLYLDMLAEKEGYRKMKEPLWKEGNG